MNNTAVRLYRRDGDWEVVLDVDVVDEQPGYWLAHAHDFLVDDDTGAPVGVVEDVELDERGRACRLTVATGRLGRRCELVPCEDVVEIVPEQRLLVIAAGPRRRVR